MHVVFIQHGDYREAVDRLEAGGGETYGYQRYTVEAVGRLLERPDVEAITVVCARCARYARVKLRNGVHAVGLDAHSPGGMRRLIDVVDELKPDRIVLRSPMRPVLRAATRRSIPTLALLADSFSTGGFRRRFGQRRLARMLNHQSVVWVGNHGKSAAQSLVSIGVDPAKVIPWDYPPERSPDEFPPKMHVSSEDHLRVFYAGVLSVEKGVTDAIDAVARLRGAGHAVSLDLAGVDRDDRIALHVARSNAASYVTLLGRIPHDQVVREMREHDVVVVPSRHVYPEGLPLTIYEALVSRTPLVVSDHPMFVGKIQDGVSGLIVREADPAHLSMALERLWRDASLYASLSHAGADAWVALQIPTKWHELPEKFVDGWSHWSAWAQSRSIGATMTSVDRESS